MRYCRNFLVGIGDLLKQVYFCCQNHEVQPSVQLQLHDLLRQGRSLFEVGILLNGCSSKVEAILR